MKQVSAKILLIENDQSEIDRLKKYLIAKAKVLEENITIWHCTYRNEISGAPYTYDEHFERAQKESVSESWTDNDIVLIDIYLLGDSELSSDPKLSVRIFQDIFCADHDFYRALGDKKKRVILLTGEGLASGAFGQDIKDEHRKHFSLINKPSAEPGTVRMKYCQATWCEKWVEEEKIRADQRCVEKDCLKFLLKTFRKEVKKHEK